MLGHRCWGACLVSHTVDASLFAFAHFSPRYRVNNWHRQIGHVRRQAATSRAMIWGRAVSNVPSNGSRSGLSSKDTTARLVVPSLPPRSLVAKYLVRSWIRHDAHVVIQAGDTGFHMASYCNPSSLKHGEPRSPVASTNKGIDSKDIVLHHPTRVTTAMTSCMNAATTTPKASPNKHNKQLRQQQHCQALWARLADACVKTLLTVGPMLRREYNMANPIPGNTSAAAKGKAAAAAAAAAATPGGPPPSLPPRSTCFTIVGMDLMVDDALEPWIIEINHLPSFR